MTHDKKFYPLTDLERFDLLQVMFPGRLSEDNEGWEAMEDLVHEEFEIDVEMFDKLVGRLVMCAPVVSSSLMGDVHHVLGKITVKDGNQIVEAAVKREPHPQEPDDEA